MSQRSTKLMLNPAGASAARRHFATLLASTMYTDPKTGQAEQKEDVQLIIKTLQVRVSIGISSQAFECSLGRVIHVVIERVIPQRTLEFEREMSVRYKTTKVPVVPVVSEHPPAEPVSDASLLDVGLC